MPKPAEARFEYIVHFVAPWRDPRLEEVQFEENLFLVTMTQDEADAFSDSLKRMFDAGFIVHSWSVVSVEAVKVSPRGLSERLAYYKHQRMRG